MREIENWACALATLGAVPPCSFEDALLEFKENEYNAALYAGMCNGIALKANAWLPASREITSKQQTRVLLQMIDEDSLAATVIDGDCGYILAKLYCADRRRVAVSVVAKDTARGDSLRCHSFMLDLRDGDALVEHSKTYEYGSKYELHAGHIRLLKKYQCTDREDE